VNFGRKPEKIRERFCPIALLACRVQDLYFSSIAAITA
jgi:hypothetical protein